jgi:hypothetical protein
MHTAGIAVFVRATMGLTPHERGVRMSDVDAPPDDQRERSRVKRSRARREQ